MLSNIMIGAAKSCHFIMFSVAVSSVAEGHRDCLVCYHQNEELDFLVKYYHICKNALWFAVRYFLSPPPPHCLLSLSFQR